MVEDPDIANTLKNAMVILPNFDQNEFPFFAVLGTAGVNILNTKTHQMKRLITTNLTLFCGMNPGFFI